MVGRSRIVSAIAVVAPLALLVGCGGSGSADDAAASRPPSAAGHSRSTEPTSPSTGVGLPRPGEDCLRPSDHARVIHFGPRGVLGGYVVGPGHRYVVLAHQSDGDACQMLPLARLLARAGYRALAFDASGRESSGAASYEHRRLSDDVLAAVRFGRAQGATSVSLIGTSMGGYGVLDAALRAHPPVSAVVSLSAPAVWDDPDGLALDISDLQVPTQLWASKLDSGFFETARTLARQDPSAQLFLRPGFDHGVALVPAAFPRIKAFLDAHTG
jgi:pimeloyl-ACP methyl ester carboxylesterase